MPLNTKLDENSGMVAKPEVRRFSVKSQVEAVTSFKMKMFVYAGSESLNKKSRSSLLQTMNPIANTVTTG